MLSAACFTAVGNSVRKPSKIAYKHAHIRTEVSVRSKHRVYDSNISKPKVCLKTFTTMDSSSIDQLMSLDCQFKTMDNSSSQAVASEPWTAPFPNELLCSQLSI